MTTVLSLLALVFSLLALVASARHLRFRRYAHRHGRGWGPRFLLRGVFRRLETSPAQEKVVVDELEALRERLRAVREMLSASRDELAAALAAEEVDAARLDGLFGKVEEQVAAVRAAAAQGLARIHDALDARQRQRLAALVKQGGHRHGYGRC